MMYFDFLPGDVEIIVKRQLLQKKTFKDQFEVIWKTAAPYINQSPDGLDDKVKSHSKSWREIGNKIYTTGTNKDYLKKSIEAYTKSIAYAPVGSTELSLAYGNRSAVLFKVRLYDECLLDIERALKISYPDHLKTKLFLRQLLCFKALKPNSRIESSISMANAIQWLPDLKKINPKYDIIKEYPKMINGLGKPREIIHFSPEIKNYNSIIVGASDAIELKNTNDNEQQHAVATRDIKSGEFIYINELFAATVSNQVRYTNCWHCCRQTWSGVPCDNCSNVIYCSDICKKKSWNSYHNIECLVLGQLLKSDELSREPLLAVKILSKALTSVGGLNELKKKIDKMNSMKNKKLILTNGILDVNTVDYFNRLGYFKMTLNELQYTLALYAVSIVIVFGEKTNILGRKMKIKDLIKNKKVLILGEIMLHYLWTAYSNGHSLKDVSLSCDSVCSNVLIPICKEFKKTCDPNIHWTHLGSNVGYFASKPIKKGKPILLNPIGSYYSISKTERFMALEVTTDDPVPCKCQACEKNWPTLQFLPSYQNLMLSNSIKSELNCMMLKYDLLRRLIKNEDIKQLLAIKDSLNNINNKFHQYITVPCLELSLMDITLKNLYGRLYTVYDFIE